MDTLAFDFRTYSAKRFLIVVKDSQLWLVDFLAPGQKPTESLVLQKLLTRVKRPFKLVYSPTQVERFASWLLQYFQGQLVKIDTQKMAWQSVSGFAQRVYRQLLTTSLGERLTYQSLAAKIGQPRAARAVGNALANNPFLVLVPCHRVIYSSKSKPDAYRSGANLKHFLHDLETGFETERSGII